MILNILARTDTVDAGSVPDPVIDQDSDEPKTPGTSEFESPAFSPITPKFKRLLRRFEYAGWLFNDDSIVKIRIILIKKHFFLICL